MKADKYSEEALEARLSAEEQDEDLTSLLQDCLRDLKRSRSFMGKFYDDWDHSLETYQQYRDVDASDARSKKRREPAKQTIPLSYAQANTFATFLVLLYTQNDRIFTLEPTGSEDFSLQEVCESILDRETRTNRFSSKLLAFCLDYARFGLGVFKSSWESETLEVTRPTSSLINFFAPPLEGGLVQEMNEEEKNEVVLKEGTCVYNVSPYNWFPDTRLPLARWEEGQFVADETVFHVKEVESWDDVYGVEWLTKFDAAVWKERGSTRLEGIDPNNLKGKDEDDFMVVVTEVQRKLVPSKYGLGEGKKEEMWVIKIANDQRIISAEKMEDANMRFTYFAGVSPDIHGRVSDSLCGVIDRLQETVTWLMNTRIESVKNNIERQLVVHSHFVELEDLQTRSPLIRLKKNAPPIGGVDNFIKQLKTNDPTVTHVQDAEVLMRMMQTVSGVNENSMGNFNGGRRSATEARNVQMGGAARLKVIATSLFQSAIAPLGKVMLINARQWMSEETFFKVLGEESEEAIEGWEAFHKEEWWELVGNEDYFVFDATSQSEKGFLAQSLQELAVALMGNPEVLMTSGLDVVKIIEKIQELRGIKNIDQFKRDEQPIFSGGQVPGQAQPGAAPGAGGAAVGIPTDGGVPGVATAV